MLGPSPCCFFYSLPHWPHASITFKVRGYAQVWAVKVFQWGVEVWDTLRTLILTPDSGLMNTSRCLLGGAPLESDQLQVKWTPPCCMPRVFESIDPVWDEMDEMSILKMTGRTAKNMKMMLFIAKAEPICCREEGGRAAFIAGGPDDVSIRGCEANCIHEATNQGWFTKESIPFLRGWNRS